jgi:hypothetical protein
VLNDPGRRSPHAGWAAPSGRSPPPPGRLRRAGTLAPPIPLAAAPGSQSCPPDRQRRGRAAQRSLTSRSAPWPASQRLLRMTRGLASGAGPPPVARRRAAPCRQHRPQLPAVSPASPHTTRADTGGHEDQMHPGLIRRCLLHRPAHCGKRRLRAVHAHHDRPCGALRPARHLSSAVRSRTCGHAGRPGPVRRHNLRRLESAARTRIAGTGRLPRGGGRAVTTVSRAAVTVISRLSRSQGQGPHIPGKAHRPPAQPRRIR